MTAPAREPAPPARSSAGTIGLWTCIALVTGNMIGSGIFLLPSSLAPFGALAIAGWLVTAAGALCLALVFARLTPMIPKAGGPYAYTREAYGDFAGFWVAWGYWIALWTGNAAIAVALAGYLRVFIPVFEGNARLCAAAAIAAVWVLTWVNTLGIRRAGALQVVTVILKLVPLLAIGTAGLFWMKPAHFEPLVPPGIHPLAAISSVMTLTLWAFLGLESATIPADSVRDPARTIPRATVVGTVVSSCVYIASTIAVMGAVPRETLGSSQAPFADAARLMWGETGYYLVGFGAIVSCFGVLNGWMLLAGQFPAAAARDGMFPAFFAKMSPRGVPALATAIAASLITVMLLFNYSGAPSLVSAFEFAILLATLANLVPYVFCSLAEILMRRVRGERHRMKRRHHVMAGIAFLYSAWAVYGAGAQTVLLGFMLLLSGIPIYVWLRRESSGAGAP
jgi:APA family basic amino acid/polyamine antiporter